MVGSLSEVGGAFSFSSFMSEVALFLIVLAYEPMFLFERVFARALEIEEGK